MKGYSAAERRTLLEALESGRIPVCPFCEAILRVSDIEPRSDVSYVRRRVWIACSGCSRAATLDLPHHERGRQ